jgi:DNA-binding FadR family transcriptional regulator
VQLPAITDVREVLEAQTSRLAAGRHEPADIEAMETAPQAIRRASDNPAIAKRALRRVTLARGPRAGR